MGRRRDDAIDLACRRWAAERRKLLGLDHPQKAREFLGAVRSTLGQRRDLHAGSTSVGRIEQHFPEVYTGDAFDVNRAYWLARPRVKAMLDVHYVARAPIAVKAGWMAVSVPQYFVELKVAKAFVEGRLAA